MTARPQMQRCPGARTLVTAPLLGALVASLLFALLLGVLTAPTSAATPAVVSTQDETTTTLPPVRDGDSPINDILPEPNSGTAPEHPSDRGGWQQILVFGLLIGGMGAIVLLVLRDSRNARRQAQS